MAANPFQDGLSVEIGADASGLTGELDNALDAVGGLETAVVGLGGALAGLSAVGFAKATSAAADFDEQMTESMAVVDDASAELEGQMEQTARTVATETTYSAEEAAEGYYFLASAGLDAEEQIAALPEVADFAAAGQIELADASDYASDIMQAFGYEAEDLGVVMDTLTATFTNHNQTAQDMGTALSYVAPVASELGMEIEETAAAIGMMGDAGIKGSRAGTALRQALSNLASPTDKQAELLEELGVQVQDSEGNMRDFTSIMGDLEEAGISTGEVMQLFGTEAGPAMQVLLSEGEEALRDNTQAIEESGGVTEEVANNQLDTFNKQWEILKSNIQEVFIQIGTVLLPTLMDLTEMLSDAVQWFQDINDATDGWAGTLSLLTVGLGGLAGTLAWVASQLGLATSAVTALTGGLSLLTGPIGLAIGLVAALGAAFATDFAGIRTHTMRVVDAFREALQPAIEWLKTDGVEIAQQIADAIVNFAARAEPYLETVIELIADGLILQIEAWAELLGEWIPKIIDWFVWFGEATSEAIDTVISTLQDWRETVEDAVARVRETLQPFIDWLEEMWEEHGQKIADEAEETWDAFSGAVDDAVSAVRETIQPFVDWITGKWETWTGDVEDNTDESWGEIEDAIDSATDTIEEIIGGMTDFVSEEWDKWGDDIMRAAEFIFDSIKGTIEFNIDLISSIITTALRLLRLDFEGAFEEIEDFVEDTLDGLVDFIEKWGIVDTIRGVFSDAGDAAGSALKSAFNSAIPSSVSLPSAEVAGETIGGGSLDLPQLDTGGLIGSDGLAMLHAGEAVVPESQIDRGEIAGGGTTINVDARGSENPRAAERRARRGVASALNAHNVPR